MRKEIGILLALICLIAGGLWLGRPAIMAKVYISLSARRLARALVAQPVGRASLQSAQDLAMRALAWQPDSVAAARLALCAIATMDTPQEVDLLVRTPHAMDTDGLSALFAGQILWKLGDRERALQTWRAHPNLTYYFANLGDQAWAQQDVQSAREYYAISQALDDRASLRKLTMYANLCEYEIGHNPAQAPEWCSRAATVDPSAWRLVTWGRALYQAGDYATVLSVLETAQRLNPEISSLFYYRGLAYQKMGRDDLALQAFREGLALAPRDPYLNFAAAELYARGGKLHEAYCGYWRVLRGSSDESLKAKARERLAALPVLAEPCGAQP